MKQKNPVARLLKHVKRKVKKSKRHNYASLTVDMRRIKQDQWEVIVTFGKRRRFTFTQREWDDFFGSSGGVKLAA